MATDIIARAMASNAMKGKGESYTKQESDARYSTKQETSQAKGEAINTAITQTLTQVDRSYLKLTGGTLTGGLTFQKSLNSTPTNIATVDVDDTSGEFLITMLNEKKLTINGYLMDLDGVAPITISSPFSVLQTKNGNTYYSKIQTSSSDAIMQFKNSNNNNKEYSIKIDNQGIILSTADSDRDIYLLTESIIEQANRIEWKKVPQSQSDDQHIYAEYMELNNVKTIDITSNNQLRITSSIGIALVSPYLTLNNNPVLSTVLLTQAEYDALETKNPNVVYNIYEPDEEEGE